MADQVVILPSDASNTGKKLDHSELTVGANTVERQRMVIADDTTAAALSKVLNSTPAGTEYAVVTRNIPSGTQTVSGTVTANAGTGPFPVSDNSGSLTIDVDGNVLTSSTAAFVGTERMLNVRGQMYSGLLTQATSTASVNSTPPTPGTGSNTTGAIAAVSVAGNATLTVSGTWTGSPVVRWQVSDDSGTTWFDIIGVRTDSYVTETGNLTLAAGVVRAWDIPLAGFTHIRFYLTTAPASGSLSLRITPGGMLYEVAPSSMAAAGTSTLTNVASSASNVTLLAANNSRKDAIIFNDSTQLLYVALTSTAASATAFSYRLSGGQVLELPQPIYTGQVNGIWAAANGNARITELT